MDNPKFAIPLSTWKKIDPDVRSLMTHTAVDDLQKRVTKIEKRPWWNKGQAFLGGIFGGIIAVAGKAIIWR